MQLSHKTYIEKGALTPFSSNSAPFFRVFATKLSDADSQVENQLHLYLPMILGFSQHNQEYQRLIENIPRFH